MQNYQGKEKETALDPLINLLFSLLHALTPSWMRVVSTRQRRFQGADVIMSITAHR